MFDAGLGRLQQADGGAADRARPRKKHLHGLIGDDFGGIVGSDRFSAYNSLEPARRQLCWSHLRHDFTSHADLGSGPQEAFGLDGLEVTWNVFHAWKQFQQDGDRAVLRRRVEEIKAQMRPLLEWGSTGKRQRQVRALARNLLKLWPALWTFADVADVDPTNRRARPPRRRHLPQLSLGSRSQGGERTIERLLSVDQTCRLQRRSLYGYLSDALIAKARGRPRQHPQLTGRARRRTRLSSASVRVRAGRARQARWGRRR